MKCDRLKRVRKKKEKAVKAKKNKIDKYKMKEDKLTGHTCRKNWEKSSKSMESEMIVRLAMNAPKKLNCYVRGVVIDDDTTTPAHLKEDKGEKSKGRLPKHLAGIRILADPSHRKKTWRNRFYKLAAMRQKKCNITKSKAKKMGKDIGYWIA